MDRKEKNRRRSSSIIRQVQTETIEEQSDQAALPNHNTSWINYKGAWIIHFVLIAVAKIIFDLVPGISQELSWTLTNLSYMAGSYLMFHYVTGIPWEFNAGAYDNLNMWEQMDNGDQYTPAKKFLTFVPIGLFLVSTHFSHYNGPMFIINTVALVLVLLPKLPSFHRMRLNLFYDEPSN